MALVGWFAPQPEASRVLQVQVWERPKPHCTFSVGILWVLLPTGEGSLASREHSSIQGKVQGG